MTNSMKINDQISGAKNVFKNWVVMHIFIRISSTMSKFR